MTYQSVNPYDGKTLETFEELTDKQLEMSLEAASTCFETWKNKTFAERAAVAAKAAAIMRSRGPAAPVAAVSGAPQQSRSAAATPPARN